VLVHVLDMYSLVYSTVQFDLLYMYSLVYSTVLFDVLYMYSLVYSTVQFGVQYSTCTVQFGVQYSTVQLQCSKRSVSAVTGLTALFCDGCCVVCFDTACTWLWAVRQPAS
jgi:hypothetical protein